ncbi:MAG: hypothetical protein M5U34_33795 [Chloroflexi bacterium]|nr:hypothetical protein [Chloroflexota bacterium]
MLSTGCAANVAAVGAHLRGANGLARDEPALLTLGLSAVMIH